MLTRKEKIDIAKVLKLADLPAETIAYISSFLEIADIAHWAKTSKRYHRFFANEMMWQHSFFSKKVKEKIDCDVRNLISLQRQQRKNSIDMNRIGNEHYQQFALVFRYFMSLYVVFLAMFFTADKIRSSCSTPSSPFSLYTNNFPKEMEKHPLTELVDMLKMSVTSGLWFATVLFIAATTMLGKELINECTRGESYIRAYCLFRRNANAEKNITNHRKRLEDGMKKARGQA